MTAGYSGRPQAQKLGLRSGQQISLDHAPRGWKLIDPPPGLTFVGAPDPADVIISFFTAAEAIPARLGEPVKRIYPDGMIWVAWPRRAGGHTSDITDNIVRNHALALGVVDVKIAAIDNDWSGQRLVWRTANRRHSIQGPSQ